MTPSKRGTIIGLRESLCIGSTIDQYFTNFSVLSNIVALFTAVRDA